jgi:acyl-CoA synthetase (AMP-forming)/AMP-acid ligase II
MDGLMMQVPLTLVHFLDRARRYFAANEIVWRRPDRSIQRSTYGEFQKRASKLANALSRMGVKPGDRVATLAWNHGRHLEAYFGIPICGGVLHTLNRPRRARSTTRNSSSRSPPTSRRRASGRTTRRAFATPRAPPESPRASSTRIGPWCSIR